MEVMISLAVLALGALAVFMHFKTRPARPSPVLDLDYSAFSRVADPLTCKRIEDAGRAALGDAGNLGAGTGIGGEECLTDGDRFVYRASGGKERGAGTAVALLDKDLRVLGTRRTISASPARA